MLDPLHPTFGLFDPRQGALPKCSQRRPIRAPAWTARQRLAEDRSFLAALLRVDGRLLELRGFAVDLAIFVVGKLLQILRARASQRSTVWYSAPDGHVFTLESPTRAQERGPNVRRVRGYAPPCGRELAHEASLRLLNEDGEVPEPRHQDNDDVDDHAVGVANPLVAPVSVRLEDGPARAMPA